MYGITTLQVRLILSIGGTFTDLRITFKTYLYYVYYPKDSKSVKFLVRRILVVCREVRLNASVTGSIHLVIFSRVVDSARLIPYQGSRHITHFPQ